MTRSFSLLLWIAATVSGTCACSGADSFAQPPSQPAAPAATPQLITPQSAVLSTDGVEITALDGSWTLSPGARFVPPVAANWYYYVPGLNGPDGPSLYVDKLKERFPGFFQVRVKVPTRAEPLYGVMVFSKLPATASGSGARLWSVAVPQEYVDRARDGFISLVYQPVDYTKDDGQRAEAASWVLWMSDVPLW